MDEEAKAQAKAARKAARRARAANASDAVRDEVESAATTRELLGQKNVG